MQNRTMLEQGIHSQKNDGEGCVYVLQRKEHEKVCKVGVSSLEAQARAKDYTDGDWEVFFELPMPAWLAKLVEKLTHTKLKKFWFDPKITGGTANEVFMCSPELAKSKVIHARNEKAEQVMRQLGVHAQVVESMWREQFIHKKENKIITLTDDIRVLQNCLQIEKNKNRQYELDLKSLRRRLERLHKRKRVWR